MLKEGLLEAMLFRRAAQARADTNMADAGERFDLDNILAVCTLLIESLRDAHSRTELHQAFCPANLHFNPDGSIELRNETSVPLGYISPEQTGRMNRRVDYRSDYYSLGVVLYELLTGHLPFEFDDMMELVHSHIARLPVPPNALDPQIPQMVSDIVLKLLAKNAEDRYQSLTGLLTDIERCRTALADAGTIAVFKLGESDICDRLQIPQKLYGRESEVDQLIDAFSRVVDGDGELLLVTGYSGIGKSSLVHEVHKPVVARHGYFISGKFDQFKRNVPYSALNDAFRELMRQILTESESRIAEWRAKLLKALGPNGQLVIEAIPELEYIIGKQPDVPLLEAARNSYNYVMQNFVGVFTRTEHPLVLFLDDLQWADSASLKLIKLLTVGLDDPYMLLIGAYRDNEIDAAHPLMLTIDEIRKEVRVSTIDVKALPEESIAELVADTFKASRKVAAPLARLIYRKTLGNPFFVGQFLKSLYHDRLLKFERNSWRWQIAQIEALGITDNVVDLLMRELLRLPELTRRLLTLAACIGNRFDIKTLATVSENTEEQVKAILRQAIQAGLIRTSDVGVMPAAQTDIYYFSHDRVQQAAYEGIPEPQKKAVHLMIGRLLFNGVQEALRDERIFDIVHQLNEGRALLTDVKEREDLARLNLQAAKKARKSAAFDVHRECLEIALEFGGVEMWEVNQTFMHELTMELIYAAFARADYAEMERLCRVVGEHSATAQQAITANDMLIRCYGALYKPSGLLKVGVESLELAGIKVPRRVSRRHIQLARLQLATALRGRDILGLADLPRATDPQYLLQLQASTAFMAYGFTYLAGSNVVLWVALQIIRKSIHYGVSPACAYAYAVWARTLAGKLGKPLEGYKFGKVSALLSTEGYLGAFGIFQGIIRHRREHFRLALQPLLDTYVRAMETGDRAGAMVALSFSDSIRFQSGGKVDDALNQIRKEIGIYRKMDYSALLGVMIPWALLFSKLVGEPIDEISRGLSSDDYVAARKKADDPWGVFYVRAIQCIGECYFCEHAQALEHAREAINLPGFDFGTPSSGFLMFVYSLSALGMSAGDGVEAKATLKEVGKMQDRFKPWAAHAPMNYLHKWQLVEAECYRVQDKTDKAATYFELAIKGAKENRFLNDEALANELAGKFYLGQGREMYARMYLEEAHAKYREWGAHAKAQQLEVLYPRLLAPQIERQRAHAMGVESAEQGLDIETIIRASQTLSGEIQLDKLLETLMLLLIENAGAQKGVLLLQRNDALTIQAVARSDTDTISVRQEVPVDHCTDASLAIINFVKRTRQNVVLGDARKDAQFGGDAYIERERPRSVLCIPLQKQSELIGILYLENNLAIDAFTSRHIKLLQILSTQIAISLENAGLYNELEQKIAARTEALSQKNEELNETLDSLRQTQKQLVESEKRAALGQLVAGVAHEINTPVGVGVTGASTLAEETAKIEMLYQTGAMKRSDLDNYVGTASTISKLLLSNMERAATLIQSFKEIAIDQTSEERRTFRLKAYIDDILLNLNPMLRGTEHAIAVDCDEAIEVDTYPGALSQIITNFVMNALLHAFREGERGLMSIAVRDLDPMTIELRFSDNGHGIPEEHLAKIFDPFFTTMRGRGGSGLGLNIIYNLVTGRLQGQISVESKVNMGTMFILRFPRNPLTISHKATSGSMHSIGASHAQ